MTFNMFSFQKVNKEYSRPIDDNCTIIIIFFAAHCFHRGKTDQHLFKHGRLTSNLDLSSAVSSISCTIAYCFLPKIYMFTVVIPIYSLLFSLIVETGKFSASKEVRNNYTMLTLILFQVTTGGYALYLLLQIIIDRLQLVSSLPCWMISDKL